MVLIGIPKREAERSLRGDGVCDKQYTVGDAVPDLDHIPFGYDLLLHGPPAPWFHALPLLRALPLRQRHCRRELDDGHC